MSGVIKDELFYGNALIISQAGQPLCTLNHKRIQWYLDKGLAEEVSPPPGYPRAIQLNFKAKLEVPNPQPYELAVIETQCVICGVKKELTLHHVIPHCIRRHFPLEDKSNSRQWCVLLCVQCHRNVEDKTQAVYKKDFPKGNVTVKERSIQTLRFIKHRGALDKMESPKYVQLLEEAGYQSAADIPDGHPSKEDKKKLRHLISRSQRELIKEWANKFINDLGGIEKTKEYFRNLFLECNPQYLPEGYLDIDVEA